MNWTGGTLQRHSKNANKGALNRQKQHFAKIRTQLQNGTAAASLPFRPGYLQQNLLEPAENLPLSDAGTFQHREQRRSLVDPELRDSQRDTQPPSSHDGASSQGRHGSSSHANNIGGPDSSGPRAYHKADYQEEILHKRRSAEANEEELLLEARRKRLLKSGDWVGLAASHPVKMHFASRKEKDQIGKRRKMEGRSSRKQHRAAHMMRQTVQDYNGDDHDMDNIRIRIGTDALPNGTPTPQLGSARLPAAQSPPSESSDPMLFDDEENFSTMAHMQSQVPDHTTPVRALPRVVQQTSTKTKQAHGSARKTHRRPGYCSGDSICSPGRSPTRFAGEQSMQGNASRREEDTGTSFHIIQQGPGPLRLVFDEVPADDARTNYAGSADQIESGSGDEDTSNNMAQAPPALIDDDGPWRAFVLQGHDSPSHSATTDRRESPPSHTPAIRQDTRRSNQLVRASGSQHATLGDWTRHTVSSSISASLPSLPVKNRVGLTDNDSGHRQPNDYCITLKHDSEELWKSYVFGGEYDSDTGLSEHRAQSASMILEPESHSKSLPSQNHASSTRSVRLPPFSSVSRNTACASDNASKLMNTNTAPRSTSFVPPCRSFSSPSVSHHAGDRWHELDVTDSLQAAEQGDFGDKQAVTDSSLFNNVSQDLDAALSPTRDSGYSRTSRAGLDQPKKSKKRRQKRSLTTWSEDSWSIYDIPVSEGRS